MANSPQNITGFETGDTSEAFATVTGGSSTLSVVSSPVNGAGAYALKVHLDSSSTSSCQYRLGQLATTGKLAAVSAASVAAVRFYFRFPSLPLSSGNGAPIFYFSTNSGNGNVGGALLLTSNGVLKVKGNNTDVALGTIALQANTWYRIDCKLTSAGTFTVRLNGIQELSLGIFYSGTVVDAGFGCKQAQMSNQTGGTFDFYVDDVALDYGDYPPNGNVSLYTATGNGNYTAWTGTASSTVPPSSTGAITDSVTGDARTVTTNASLLANTTVNSVKAIAYVEAGNATNSLAARLRSNTTDSSTAGVTSLSTSSYTPLAKIFSTDPATSAAWTYSAANSAQPGVVNVTAGGTSSCEAIYKMVDSIAANTPQNIVGFETGDLSESWHTTVSSPNTIGVVTSPVNGAGAYALNIHYDSSNTGQDASVQVGTIAASGTITTSSTLSIAAVRFYFRFAALPGLSGASNAAPIFFMGNSAGQSAVLLAGLSLTSTGKLQLCMVSSSSLATGTTTLSANTWYRIDVLYVATATATAVVRINGTQEVTLSNASANGVGAIDIGFGARGGYAASGGYHGGSVAGYAMDLYFDDVALDSNGYPPDGNVVIGTAKGTARGTAWSGTAASAVPPSSSGAITSTTTGDIRSVCSSLDTSSIATINSYKAMAYVKAGTSGNSLGAFMYVGSTAYVTTGATSLSTSVYTPLALLKSQNPNSSAGWLPTDVNATQPGVKNITAGGTSSCEAIYAMVDGTNLTLRANVPKDIFGFETGETSELFTKSVAGTNTVSVVSSPVNVGGSYSLNIHYGSTSANGYAEIGALSANGRLGAIGAVALVAFRFYFRFSALPSGTQPIITIWNQQGNNPIKTIANLSITSAGKLTITTGSGTATGSTVLSANTWYRIDFKVTNNYNGTTGTTVAARINGVSEVTGNYSASSGNVTDAIFGSIASATPNVANNASTWDFYIDDVAVDYLDYPPNGNVLLYTATGTGTDTAWTGTASSTVPPSSTGAITNTVSGAIRTVTTGANYGSGSTINSAKALAFAKSSDQTSTLAARLRSGSSVLDSTGSNSWNVYALFAEMSATDPATSTTWTYSGVSSAQPGVKSGSLAAATHTCEAIYLVIDGIFVAPVVSSSQIAAIWLSLL